MPPSKLAEMERPWEVLKKMIVKDREKAQVTNTAELEKEGEFIARENALNGKFADEDSNGADREEMTDPQSTGK
jgi:hypothetical protein